MTDESRIGKLESDVQHLQADVTEIKVWMVITGAGTILSVWGAAVALARFLKP